MSTATRQKQHRPCRTTTPPSSRHHGPISTVAGSRTSSQPRTIPITAPATSITNQRPSFHHHLQPWFTTMQKTRTRSENVSTFAPPSSPQICTVFPSPPDPRLTMAAPPVTVALHPCSSTHQIGEEEPLHLQHFPRTRTAPRPWQ
ncbi:hypothetical protein DEO72_LG10g2494 [Vigna unguiculata]|uniref:Uncharacterized protein n=1 Tax=Vigna unguiculata TaxID=3917 RepID=A0A4D6NEF8_VIGUN|nr:hypothetical protein DEO72_LG10g2494 [Vigna unguiculata]